MFKIIEGNMTFLEKIANFLIGKNKKYDELTDDERKELEISLVPEGNQHNQTTQIPNTVSPMVTGDKTNEEMLKVLQAVQEDLNNQKKANTDLLKRIDDEKKAQIKQKVDRAITEAIQKGKISPKDEEGKKKWEKRLTDNYDDQIELLNVIPEQKFKPDATEGNKGASSPASEGAKTLDRARLVKQASEAFKTNK